MDQSSDMDSPPSALEAASQFRELAREPYTDAWRFSCLVALSNFFGRNSVLFEQFDRLTWGGPYPVDTSPEWNIYTPLTPEQERHNSEFDHDLGLAIGILTAAADEAERMALLRDEAPEQPRETFRSARGSFQKKASFEPGEKPWQKGDGFLWR